MSEDKRIKIDELEEILEEVKPIDDSKIDRKKLWFYEKLRKKLTSFASDKAGDKGTTFSNYLMALPDFFMLLCRLMIDRRVTAGQKAFIAGVIGYVVFPIDIIPDFIPIIGFADDLVLVVYGLNFILNELDKQIVLDNWSGQTDLLGLLAKISATAENYLDRNVIKKIKKWLTKNKAETLDEVDDSVEE